MQIYILNRARETLATTASIYDDKHTMTLEAGSSSYEFTIDKSDSASKSLETGNYIVLQDDNGKTWLFTILDYEETHNTKTVYAEDAGIELINKAMDIWTLNGSHPFKYYFDLVTKDTPWTLGVNRLEGLSRSLKFDGRDTGLGRLLSILKAFDHAECSFDVTVKMNAPADFKINVYKQIGNDRSDVQIVYNSELDDIKKKESRAEFVTALAGVGGQIQSKDGTSEGNVDFSALEYNKDGFVTKKGDKFLRAVDANKVFNPGHESYIESFYEYDTQSPSELLSRTLSKLKIYSEPQYTYNAEVKVIDPSLNLGDTVTILDHDYNPALYLSARVAKMVKSYTDPTRNEIEFTNYRLLSRRLADKLARLQTIVNQMPSASQVGKLESNVSALSSKTDELASQITSANGKNTNYYGKTEPANPKNGDLWYKKLKSGETEMYQYQDGTWQLLASTADLTTVQTELGQAKADMAQAKTDAQTAYDEAIRATNTANGAKAETTKALEQAKQANSSYTALSKEVADNKASVDVDYQKVQADIAQAKKDLSSVTGTVTEVKKGQGELSAKVAGKVDNTVYQTYVEQTNQALSEKLVASDLQSYAKIADIKQTTDGLSASITKVQGNLSSLQIGGANLLDGSSMESTKFGDCSYNSMACKGGWTLLTSSSAASGRRAWYYVLPVGQPEPGTYTASLDVKLISCKSELPKAQVMIRERTNWHGYANGEELPLKVGETVRMSATGSVPSSTSAMKIDIEFLTTSTFVGQIAIRHVKLEKGNRPTDWCMSDNDVQSQLDTLSGKITATSDRLSSVYTKSETDKKLSTKVEQSAFTQTSNSLSASIAENSKTLANNTSKITQLTADVNGVKTTVADHTGKITQLTTDVNGVKSTVSNKVDKTTYQSYVTQTDKALSAKLTASDLQGYAKTTDLETRAGKIEASLTSLQGDMSYKATTLVDKPEFSDGDVGGWVAGGKPAVLYKTGGVDGYHYSVQSQNIDNLYASAYWKPVASESKWYVEALIPNFEPAGGKNVYANASLYYIRPSDGKNAWSFVDCGAKAIAPQHWGWVKGYVTVPYGVTKVKPCISMKRADGTNIKSAVKYCQFTLVNAGVQNQLTTLSGKITATSDRLSSVYTKSETDAKLKTKVEQSALTQTSNNLSASIAKNSKILSSAGLVNENAYINANKIALNGKTLMTNATINDAFIGNVSANKITTGTLNAAKVNLINVNASNISTGTLNGVKIVSTGKDPSGTSSTTTIQSGYIDTNVINCSDYILVGKADADPRKRWQTKQDSFGTWFTCPAKLNGHTGNAPSDWQTEMQGFIGSDGWNYKSTTVSGTGFSGIKLVLTPEQEWGRPYGGDQWSIGNWIRTEASGKSGDIRDGMLDPVMWYSYTGQGAAYADQLVIQKKTQFFDKANFQGGVRIGVTGANHGIRTAWVSWSDWGSNQKIPCIVQDTTNWGGIAFPSNGRVVLFTHGYRINTDGLPKDKGGTYNGWGS